jgi:exodeoxyribonuclease V beta subunit
LHGSRLIEASAGTGKTWTIAALYLRLVLGPGGSNAFVRPLQPAEILVMTFTRAATRELSDRIRSRLIEAAQVFRGDEKAADPFLSGLLRNMKTLLRANRQLTVWRWPRKRWMTAQYSRLMHGVSACCVSMHLTVAVCLMKN